MGLSPPFVQYQEIIFRLQLLILQDHKTYDYQLLALLNINPLFCTGISPYLGYLLMMRRENKME
jgi:hypothetical protein